jgi:hypothetical protein
VNRDHSFFTVHETENNCSNNRTEFLVRVIPVHAVIYLFLTVHETGKKSQTGIFKSLFLTVHEPE